MPNQFELLREILLIRPTKTLEEFTHRVCVALKLLPSNKNDRQGVLENPVILAACLYGAYHSWSGREIADALGIAVGKVRSYQIKHSLPRNSREYAHLLQMGILAQLMQKEASPVLEGLTRVTDVLNRACDVCDILLDKALEKQRVDELTKLNRVLTGLAKLSVPIAFLYRDSLDAEMNARFDHMAKHKWTRKTLDEMVKLIDPSLSGTPPEQAEHSPLNT